MPTVYETVRLHRGTFPFLDRHRRRLIENCRAEGLAVPPDFTKNVVAQSHSGNAMIRIEWDGTALHVTSQAVASPTAFSVRTVSVVHRGYRTKTKNRGFLQAARAEARKAGADDALLLTADGYVAEGSLFAVGWFVDGVLEVPALELGVLPSVGRARVLEIAPRLGIRARDGSFSVSRLYDRPIFGVTASRGVVPLASFNGRVVPRVPELTELRRRFWP